MMGFSEQLKALRRNNGLTLQSLADASNLSVSFLSDLETGRGKPSIDTLYLLATVLNTDMNTLTGFEGDTVPGSVRIANVLRVLDIDSLSPLDALTKLYELKRMTR